MKRFTKCLIFSLGLAFNVQGEDTQLPERAQKLRDSYTAAVERATTPLTKTYLTELQRLKAEQTKAGDLKGALAIESEINRLSPPTATTQGAPKLKARETRVLRELEIKQVGTKFYAIYFPGRNLAGIEDAEKAALSVGGRVARVTKGDVTKAINELQTKTNVFIYNFDEATRVETPKIRLVGGRMTEPFESNANSVAVEFDTNPHGAVN